MILLKEGMVEMESMDLLFTKAQEIAQVRQDGGETETYRQEYAGLIGFYEYLVEKLYDSYPEARAMIERSIRRRIDLADMQLEQRG